MSGVPAAGKGLLGAKKAQPHPLATNEIHCFAHAYRRKKQGVVHFVLLLNQDV